LAKIKNFHKIVWARNLLAQNLTVKQVQLQLKEMFGSGINNNELRLLRNQNNSEQEKIPMNIGDDQKNIQGISDPPSPKSSIFEKEVDDTPNFALNEFFRTGTSLLRNEFTKFQIQFTALNSNLIRLENNINVQINQLIEKISEIQSKVDPIVIIKGQILEQLSNNGKNLDLLAVRINISPKILSPILGEMIDFGVIKFDDRSGTYTLL
jgi:hypothetical protein